ncbi:MAG: YdcH family protein [Alphaproteobacteria bacterium]
MHISEKEKLLKELSILKEEHETLSDKIETLIELDTFNQLEIQRLKKQKLKIKDMINLIESKIYPDIIA